MRRLAALLLLAAAACGPRGGGVERVVLVTIDTLRADKVGSYGGNPAATPHLDALSTRGTRFETAISSAPLTLPSHATILTGRDPLSHGIHDNGVYQLPEGVPTLATAFHERGMATAAFVAAVVLDRRFGLARDFDTYDDRMDLETATRSATGMASRRGNHVVDAALHWLETAPPRFFLWVHLYDPHADYDAPEPFASRFKDHPYVAEVAFADAQVGRLLDAIDARFDSRGTLLAVTSDHGESLGDHGEPTHSYGLYDSTQHVPFWLAGPGVPPGRSVRQPVRLEDVAPTLLAFVGAKPLAGSTGASLMPLLGDADAEVPPAYLETVATRLDYGWSPLFGIRTARHKYVKAPRPELYDLAADPRELHNLADAQPEVRGRLEALLEQRMAGRVPEPPNYQPDQGSRAELEALGYVVPAAGGDADVGRVDGPDPKDHIGEVRALDDANTLLGAEHPREALAALDRIPGHTFETEMLRAIAYFGVGDRARAREAAQRTIAAAPQRSTGYLLLARAYEGEGQTEKARAALARADQVEPDSSDVAEERGRLAEAHGQLAEAETLYRRAVQARVPTPQAHWRLAALAIERRDFTEAEALLAELPPYELRRSEAAARLARAELHAGRLDLGLLRADAGLREHPDEPGLLAIKAQILEESGRVGEALALRERLLAASPGDPAARNAVAWDLGRLGQQLPRALGLARGVVADTNGDPGALDTLASVLMARGEAQEALAAVERALPKATGEVRSLLLFRRAEALGALGRAGEAREALRTAREASPGTDRAVAEVERRAERRVPQ